jgi:hypothetical protein
MTTINNAATAPTRPSPSTAAGREQSASSTDLRRQSSLRAILPERVGRAGCRPVVGLVEPRKEALVAVLDVAHFFGERCLTWQSCSWVVTVDPRLLAASCRECSAKVRRDGR